MRRKVVANMKQHKTTWIFGVLWLAGYWVWALLTLAVVVWLLDWGLGGFWGYVIGAGCVAAALGWMVTLDRECRRNVKIRKNAAAPDDAGKVPPPEPEAEQPAGSKPGIRRWSKLLGWLSVLLPLLGLLLIIFNTFKAIDITNDGVAAYKAGDFEAAARHFRAAAELGYGEAQHILAHRYASGEGVEQDLNEAVKWYKKAAKQGNSMAQIDLGDCYFNGTGVELDLHEAVKWYRKAAHDGHSGAQRRLGDCYFNASGVKQDHTKAVKWYRKAAEQGNAKAQYELGKCYHEGKGVEKDMAEAVKWYRLAAEQDNTDAKEALKELNLAE